MFALLCKLQSEGFVRVGVCGQVEHFMELQINIEGGGQTKGKGGGRESMLLQSEGFLEANR